MLSVIFELFDFREFSQSIAPFLFFESWNKFVGSELNFFKRGEHEKTAQPLHIMCPIVNLTLPFALSAINASYKF